MPIYAQFKPLLSN